MCKEETAVTTHAGLPDGRLHSSLSPDHTETGADGQTTALPICPGSIRFIDHPFLAIANLSSLLLGHLVHVTLYQIIQNPYKERGFWEALAYFTQVEAKQLPTFPFLFRL